MTSQESGRPPLDIVERREPPASSINDSIVALTSIGAGVLSLVFAISLLAGGSITLYGSALSGAMLLLAVAVRRYFTGRYPDVTAVEPRTEVTDDAPVAEVTPVGPR